MITGLDTEPPTSAQAAKAGAGEAAGITSRSLSASVGVILLLHTAAVLAPAAILSNTFTNPTPAATDEFGFAVAAVGTSRLLIAAQNHDAGSGAAYLFDRNGALVTTFANPRQADAGFSRPHFGFALTTLGSEGALIGAYGADVGATDAGAAYLFTLNGTLVTTFTNPTPAFGDAFGVSVASLGESRALIGAYGDDTGAPQAGAAYLFNTNGAWLNTFTNPAPHRMDNFGWKLAAVGNDRVLITAPSGASGGSAYLFNTNGTLLITLHNPKPTPGQEFGISGAVIGGDKILIGAHQDDTGATDAGIAYLFDTNGMLLTTFTNPAPAIGDNFGFPVTPLDSDRVLIGAQGNDTGATDAGVVYLFRTDGTLLARIDNPFPEAGDRFGAAVAALDEIRVLIGARLDDTGANDAGSAYLLDMSLLEQPQCRFLSFARGGAVTFQTSSSNLYVGFQYNPDLGNTNGWQNVPNPYWDLLITNLTTTVSFPTNLPLESLFLRLVCSRNSLVGNTYEVYGGDSFSTDEDRWFEKGYEPAQYGYIFLGSATNSSTFAGAHNVYIIRAPPYNVAKVDAVVGSDAAYYPAATSGNTPDWSNIDGPPDGMAARVGIEHYDKGGFVVVHAFNNLTSITVQIVR